MEKGTAKSYTPTKPPYNSYMTHVSEHLGYQVMNQINEMGDIVLKNVDLSHLK
jgi:hypothetical protein